MHACMDCMQHTACHCMSFSPPPPPEPRSCLPGQPAASPLSRRFLQSSQPAACGATLRVSPLLPSCLPLTAISPPPPPLRFLPASLQLVGYARSPMTDQELRDRIRPGLPKDKPEAVSRVCVCVRECGGRRARSPTADQELRDRIRPGLLKDKPDAVRRQWHGGRREGGHAAP